MLILIHSNLTFGRSILQTLHDWVNRYLPEIPSSTKIEMSGTWTLNIMSITTELNSIWRNVRIYIIHLRFNYITAEDVSAELFIPNSVDHSPNKKILLNRTLNSACYYQIHSITYWSTSGCSTKATAFNNNWTPFLSNYQWSQHIHVRVHLIVC